MQIKTEFGAAHSYWRQEWPLGKDRQALQTATPADWRHGLCLCLGMKKGGLYNAASTPAHCKWMLVLGTEGARKPLWSFCYRRNDLATRLPFTSGTWVGQKPVPFWKKISVVLLPLEKAALFKDSGEGVEGKHFLVTKTTTLNAHGEPIQADDLQENPFIPQGIEIPRDTGRQHFPSVLKRKEEPLRLVRIETPELSLG